MPLGAIGGDEESLRESKRMREFESLRESESKRKERRRFFFRENRSYGEYEEMKKIKGMKKKKKWLVTVGENEKAGTHLMAKLRVVYASPLNYM